jgi:hypothetical protein
MGPSRPCGLCGRDSEGVLPQPAPHRGHCLRTVQSPAWHARDLQFRIATWNARGHHHGQGMARTMKLSWSSLNNPQAKAGIACFVGEAGGPCVRVAAAPARR